MQHWSKTCNELGKAKIPFLLLSDFEMEQVQVIPLEDLEEHHVKIVAPTFSNYSNDASVNSSVINPLPIDFAEFTRQYNLVQQEISYGNTFLCNLTASTQLQDELNLLDIFEAAQSLCKIKYKDDWVCFTPERFVSIKNNTITTNPMKGTIDANLPNAAATILADEKETAEHYTIVDLLRNDLSIVSTNVQVEQFRYLTKISSGNGELLQVSSKISGELASNWNESIGDILEQLLPAGSISGAPKKKTLEIINATEQHPNGKRGYYTGVAAIFDGKQVDSFVLIRFIEKIENKYFYKSGGGITYQSTALQEYNELQQKIYIPTAWQ
jgi:para-aminobenzoate synthetase component I